MVEAKIKKLLTILAVLAVALAIVAVSIEAQRGGGGRAGSSGGSGGGMHIEPNINDNGNANFNGNFPGNYDAIEVSVTTDKWRYVLDEPIEITVTAYNPTDHPVGDIDWDGCVPIGYIIDGYITRTDYVDENGTVIPGVVCMGGGIPYVLQPGQTLTWIFTRTTVIGNLGTGLGVGYYPSLPVGRHSVVGIVSTRDYEGDIITVQATYKSRPITVWVVEPN